MRKLYRGRWHSIYYRTTTTGRWQYCRETCLWIIYCWKQVSSYRKEYIVAHKNVYVDVDNIPYCCDCLKRTKLTGSELVTGILSLMVMVPVVALILYNNIDYLCPAIILGVLLFLGLVILSSKILVDVSEGDVVFITANKNWTKFQFRNKKFASLFNDLNNPGSKKYPCSNCGSNLMWNLETNKWVCYNCSVL